MVSQPKHTLQIEEIEISQQTHVRQTNLRGISNKKIIVFKEKTEIFKEKTEIKVSERRNYIFPKSNKK